MNARLLTAILLLGASATAQAHTRGTSYSSWTLDGPQVEVQARVSQLELTRLGLDPRLDPDYLAHVAAVLRHDLLLETPTGPCTPGPATTQAGDDGWLSAHWALDCPTREALTIRTRLFAQAAPSHLHFVRVERGGGMVEERVLSLDAPSFTVVRAQPPASAFTHFVQLGVGHILSGWDHLAFVLALILLSRRLREVALIATGFTLAHSLTLAAAVLGWVTVQQGRIEALIGFSIALVAAENLWRRAQRDPWLPRLVVIALALFALVATPQMPWALAAALALFCACYFALGAGTAQPLGWRAALAVLFGLVHGFGFAGALTALDLPTPQLASGLLGFNLGVEIGQLLVIGLVWPLLALLRRAPRWESALQQGLSCALVALGSFWFVARSLGG
ncbi:MAG TPA: HupE/UreJ family protein [Solimonas sp.]|nr:HupE/UreJ family protein [Solimonas sp.]